MKISKLAILFILIGMFLLAGSSFQPDEKALAKRAAKIHHNVLTVDSHCDTPLRFLRSDFDISQRHDSRRGGGKVDLPRMKEGGLDAIFFAAFIGQGPRTPAAHEKVREKAVHIFKVIQDTIKKHSDLAELAFTPDDAYRIEKSDRRAIFIGMENGYPIGNDLSMIQTFYDLGARYITLCHTQNNDICDSSTDTTEHRGLSEFGKKVVAAMNRIGMMIDVSHASDESLEDILEESRAPVIASHSCARAICDNPRNLNDELLKKLAENGGVIQMCILSAYVKPEEPNPERDAAFKALREKYKNFRSLSPDDQKKAGDEWDALEAKYPQKLATVSDVVDHIDHIVKVAGIDHVGIGTDFDGGGSVIGCYDVSEMGNITLELVNRGYSEKQIRKIWGGNLMRVMRKVEKVAMKLRETKVQEGN